MHPELQSLTFLAALLVAYLTYGFFSYRREQKDAEARAEARRQERARQRAEVEAEHGPAPPPEVLAEIAAEADRLRARDHLQSWQAHRAAASKYSHDINDYYLSLARKEYIRQCTRQAVADEIARAEAAEVARAEAAASRRRDRELARPSEEEQR